MRVALRLRFDNKSYLLGVCFAKNDLWQCLRMQALDYLLVIALKYILDL